MERKIIEYPSFTSTIERLVQIPANLILNFSLDKINKIPKEFYYCDIARSYIVIKGHLYGIYKTFLDGDPLLYSQKSAYLEIFNTISNSVSKSMVSCRSIGEKCYGMPKEPQFIESYYQEFVVIAKRVRLPQKDNNSYQNIIQDALLQGYITKNDAEYFLHHLNVVALGVHIVWQIIQKMFQEYQEIGILSTIYDNQQQPHIEKYNSHFKVDISYSQAQSILTKLQKNGYISNKTTAETFYYRMTGVGKSTSEKIEWIKKGKRRKTELSKSGLVYFLRQFANYKVDKTQQCNDTIEDIFGLKLSSSTITNTTQCELKEDIDYLIRTILQS